jgi:hypothetical protein
MTPTILSIAALLFAWAIHDTVCRYGRLALANWQRANADG